MPCGPVPLSDILHLVCRSTILRFESGSRFNLAAAATSPTIRLLMPTSKHATLSSNKPIRKETKEVAYMRTTIYDEQ